MNYSSALTPRTRFILVLIALAAMSRLLPHPANFSPIGAIALFAGAFIPGRNKLVLPLAALLLSDIMMELFNHTGFYKDMIFVYGSFAAVVVIGSRLNSNPAPVRVLTASLTASVLFFMVTNFGTFLLYDIYPHTPAGLLQAYTAGIPFFRGTVLGDLVYTTVLFGSFILARRRYPVLA